MANFEATPEQIALAFTEWERRYRENPEKFMTESEKLAETPESYGDACAPYFLTILEEVKSEIPNPPSEIPHV